MIDKFYDTPTYCVYGYFLNDVCLYIGHGCEESRRPYRRGGRSKDVLAVMNNPDCKIKLLHTKLSKFEAEAIENDYLDKYYQNPTDTFKLLNKKGARTVHELHPQEFIHLLKIDPSSKSGLSWLYKVNPKVRDDLTAGTFSNFDGYWYINVNNKRCKVHRVVMALHTNEAVPRNLVVNHINGDKSDNRPENLEYVTQQVNVIKKTKLRCDNKSGVQGVAWIKNENTWRGTFSRNSKTISKIFNPKDFDGNNDKAFEAAVSWYKDTQARCEEITNSTYIDGKKLNKNNKFNMNGIHFESGNTNTKGRFRAKFKGKQMSFSISKHGYDEAFRLACEWRKQMEESTK